MVHSLCVILGHICVSVSAKTLNANILSWQLGCFFFHLDLLKEKVKSKSNRQNSSCVKGFGELEKLLSTEATKKIDLCVCICDKSWS